LNGAEGGSMWRRLRLGLGGLLAFVLAVVGGSLLFRQSSAVDRDSVLPAGDELELEKMSAYGWSESMAVGTRFTDGFSFISVSPAAKAPIRLLSVTPVMDDGKALKVLGVLARITPDMLPPHYEDGWFQLAAGFPPTDHDATGGADPGGLVVRVPRAGEELEIELEIGYEVVAPGKSNRKGVRVRYEYEGRTHEYTARSHLSICAPATTRCEAEDTD
jgi:hypothetical protein